MSEGWGNMSRFAKGTVAAVWKTKASIEARSQLGGHCRGIPEAWQLGLGRRQWR